MKRFIDIGLALALALACSWGPLGETARADDFVIIKNAKTKQPPLSKDDLRAIFTGRTRSWPAGGQIILVVLGSDKMDSTAKFAEAVFGVPAKTLLTKVRQQVFKGEMQKPTWVNSDAECAQAVASTEGAIGVVLNGVPVPAGADTLEVAK